MAQLFGRIRPIGFTLFGQRGMGMVGSAVIRLRCFGHVSAICKGEIFVDAVGYKTHIWEDDAPKVAASSFAKYNPQDARSAFRSPGSTMPLAKCPRVPGMFQADLERNRCTCSMEYRCNTRLNCRLLFRHSLDHR